MKPRNTRKKEYDEAYELDTDDESGNKQLAGNGKLAGHDNEQGTSCKERDVVFERDAEMSIRKRHLNIDICLETIIAGILYEYLA